ncbi:MAG: hypothetical protein RIT14_2108 [Pseudomonadota bacterium]
MHPVLLRLQSLALRLPQSVVALLAFAFAGGLSVLVAWGSAVVIESRSATVVSQRLEEAGVSWASVQADGLLVRLIGTAPNEAARFRVVNLAGSVIDSGRVRDELDVTPVTEIEAPRFSVEMLRNDDGIQLIGLLPAGGTEAILTAAAEDISAGTPVTDMLETAAYPAPTSWQAAFDYGLFALQLLPRSKISVAADGVEITAIAISDAEKRRLESELSRQRPDGLGVRFDISAPRPVLTPFILRFVMDDEGTRFDACSADTESARSRILAAAVEAGLESKGGCTVGLGVPSPRWAEAAVAGIQTIAALGAGTITFSDADVTLLAPETIAQSDFDRAVGDLEAALPDVFSLDATLLKKTEDSGPAEFTADLTTKGKVELRGRLSTEMLRAAVDSFAKAEFGSDNVYAATLLDPELPDGWPVRVLAGLEALGELEHGKLLVRQDTVEISGVTGSQSAKGRISQILSGKLGKGQTFKVAVTYDEALDPLASIPTPEECIEKVNALLAKQKITFTPGSAEIDAQAVGLMNALAEALSNCPALPMEIGGHTDAQGSEDGNRALSQARAEAVLIALEGRRVDVSAMKAVGYGESRPLADNANEEGREANRRIEFSLIGAATTAVATLPEGTEAPEGQVDAATGLVVRGQTISARQVPGSAQACVKDIQTLLEKQKITFDPGSDSITDASDGLLTALATMLKQCPGVPIEVAGHTDSEGTERGNRTLSQDRAKAVLDALQERGVNISAMTAVGYGEEKPVADNETAEGREANRRIEFTLIGAAGVETGGESLAPVEKTLRPKPRPANNG